MHRHHAITPSVLEGVGRYSEEIRCLTDGEVRIQLFHETTQADSACIGEGLILSKITWLDGIQRAAGGLQGRKCVALKRWIQKSPYDRKIRA